jgi:anaerobic ribonucleoside-triphosphate reductase
MAIRKIDQVRKRDGRAVPYEELKIAEAITRAARAAGLDNGAVGRDLASVVTMYLERYHAEGPPGTEEIRRLVEKILFDTGHASVARAFIVHRERKGQPAEAPPPPAEDLFPANLLLVDGATTGELAPWGRDRIIAALTKEAGLEAAAAEGIAGAVEQKIFRLGQRRISSSLIRELVNHELLERGFGSKLRRQIVVGLPKYDLGRLVGDEEARVDPDELCRTIGQATLRQYALQEIFARDVADAHIEGRLHLHGLEDPLKLHAIWPSAPGLRRSGFRVRGSAALSEPARDARTFTAQLGRAAAELRRLVSGPIVFGGLSEVYDQLLWGAGEDALREEMEHLGAALDGCGASVRPQHRSAPPLAALGSAVVLVSGMEGVPLKEFCRTAAERGMTFVFERGGPGALPREACAGEAWSSTAQAVTVNLPQAFLRSESGSDFYTELEGALELAVKAQLQKRQQLRKFADRETGGFGQALGLVPGGLRFEDLDYAIGLAGLNEAVKLLSGEEILGSDAAVRLALRIVSYVWFRLREEGARHGLRLALEDVPGAEPAERFARIDAQLYPRARGILADRARYSPGFRVRGGGPAEALPVESRFHTLVPTARAVVDRGRLSPADLYAMLQRLHGESLAARVAVE